MNLAEGISNILAKLCGFDAKFEALQESISKLSEANSTANTDLEAKNVEITELKAKFEEFKATAEAELKAEQESLIEKINTGIQAELAKAGHVPINTKLDDKSDGKTFSQKLAAITDPTERTQFLRDNKAELHAENARLKTSK